MTEQTELPEPSGGAEEQPGKPIPNVSEPSADEKPSSQQVDLDALAEKVAAKLTPTFEEMSKRSAQSAVDKRAYQFDRVAEYLKASGGDPKKAAREMALDQMIERETGNPSSEPEVRGRTKGKDNETRVAEFLENLKEESDVEFTNAELKTIWPEDKEYPNLEAAFNDIRKAAWKKVRQESVGTGAVVQEGGRRASRPDAEKKYRDEMLAARGRGAAVGREIKAKYRKIGVDVDNVNLYSGPAEERDPRREQLDHTRK